jgi:peptidylprolyl isomerase
MGLIFGLCTATSTLVRSPHAANAKPTPAALKQTAAPEDMITLDSGLKYIDQEVGQGAIAQRGQIVLVHYVGRLEDGTVFDSSWGRNWPFAFPLGGGRVIPGWDIGVQGMRVGGQRTLVIPSELAYGDREMGPIPPHSTLIFEIELFGLRNPE